MQLIMMHYFFVVSMVLLLRSGIFIEARAEEAQESVAEVEVAIDASDLPVEHVSSRLARLQERKKLATLTKTVSGSNSPSAIEDANASNEIAFLRALSSLARELPVPVGKRIAVGWNSNVDMIVAGCDLVRHDFPNPNPRDVEKITSMVDFSESFAYWFEKGAAAERFVDTAALFKQIVELAKSQSSRIEYKTGGNAALMATALAEEKCQCDVLLGGLVGSQLSNLLSPSIRTVQNASQSQGDGSSEDAIHLIMEYSKGEKWGNITSPRHNRFIVVHDEYNAKIEGLESLSEKMISENSDNSFSVFIASGLNQLEGLETQTRDIRLATVAAHLHSMDPAMPVHLELASMAHRDFLVEMFSKLAVHSDSLGLNEEELAMLYEVLGGSYAESTTPKSSFSFTKEMLTGRVPDPRSVSYALLYVLDTVYRLHSSSDKLGLRLVSRIHFHCLSFHIIVLREGLDSSSSWQWTTRMDAAVSRGAVAAASKACAMKDSDLLASHIDILAPLSFPLLNGDVMHINLTNPVAIWNHGGHAFYLAPVPVCKIPKNTVGLGDTISANALAYSLTA